MRQRIDRIVRLLARREEAATAERARAGRAVATAREEVTGAREACRELAPPSGELSALQLQSLRLRGLGAVDQLERARKVLDERQEEELDAERERSAAAVRRRSVERLAERRREVSRHTAAAASQRSLDELAALHRAAGVAGTPSGPQEGATP